MNELPRDIKSGEPSAVDRLQIGDLTLDLRREELRDAAGARIDLRNRSFGVLRYLATNAGRVVFKDELLAANWPGVTVTEDSLTQCISEIRRQLGESGARSYPHRASPRLHDRFAGTGLPRGGGRFGRAHHSGLAIRERHPGRRTGCAGGRADAADHLRTRSFRRVARSRARRDENPFGPPPKRCGLRARPRRGLLRRRQPATGRQP